MTVTVTDDGVGTVLTSAPIDSPDPCSGAGHPDVFDTLVVRGDSQACGGRLSELPGPNTVVYWQELGQRWSAESEMRDAQTLSDWLGTFQVLPTG